jgi:hypothetical protein
MSRPGYCDDTDNWQFIRWRGAVKRAIRGKRGQEFLRELLAVPDGQPLSSPRRGIPHFLATLRGVPKKRQARPRSMPTQPKQHPGSDPGRNHVHRGRYSTACARPRRISLSG